MAEAPRPQARVKGAPSGPPGSIDHSDEEGSLIGSAAVEAPYRSAVADVMAAVALAWRQLP